jgi:hypothetical protein
VEHYVCHCRAIEHRASGGLAKEQNAFSVTGTFHECGQLSFPETFFFEALPVAKRRDEADADQRVRRFASAFSLVSSPLISANFLVWVHRFS